MEFKSTTPVALLSVITDVANRKSEVVDTDTLRLHAIVVNHQTESMVFSFVWGGYDSNKKFHVHPQLPASSRSIQRNAKCLECTNNPKAVVHRPNCQSVLWHHCTKDENGNPILDHGEAFVKKVMLDYRVIDDVVNGGWDFPDGIELTYNGQSVFKKEPAPDPKAVAVSTPVVAIKPDPRVSSAPTADSPNYPKPGA